MTLTETLNQFESQVRDQKKRIISEALSKNAEFLLDVDAYYQLVPQRDAILREEDFVKNYDSPGSQEAYARLPDEVRATIEDHYKNAEPRVSEFRRLESIAGNDGQKRYFDAYVESRGNDALVILPIKKENKDADGLIVNLLTHVIDSLNIVDEEEYDGLVAYVVKGPVQDTAHKLASNRPTLFEAADLELRVHMDGNAGFVVAAAAEQETASLPQGSVHEFEGSLYYDSKTAAELLGLKESKGLGGLSKSGELKREDVIVEGKTRFYKKDEIDRIVEERSSGVKDIEGKLYYRSDVAADKIGLKSAKGFAAAIAHKMISKDDIYYLRQGETYFLKDTIDRIAEQGFPKSTIPKQTKQGQPVGRGQSAEMTLNDFAGSYGIDSQAAIRMVKHYFLNIRGFGEVEMSQRIADDRFDQKLIEDIIGKSTYGRNEVQEMFHIREDELDNINKPLTSPKRSHKRIYSIPSIEQYFIKHKKDERLLCISDASALLSYHFGNIADGNVRQCMRSLGIDGEEVVLEVRKAKGQRRSMIRLTGSEYQQIRDNMFERYVLK